MAEAQDYRSEVGLPLVVRPAYTLGGTGGGIAETDEEFATIVESGLSASPISQVLLERSLVGWKEVEYEVIRDGADNCITVCNMENLDPMGAHTGDSIVVAPSQTLTDKEYQMLRTASLNIIRGLGIEGGCNIQLALRPHPRRHAETPRRLGSRFGLLRDRSEPPGQPLFRAGQQSHRIPNRPSVGENRGGPAAGRDLPTPLPATPARRLSRPWTTAW